MRREIFKDPEKDRFGLSKADHGLAASPDEIFLSSQKEQCSLPSPPPKHLRDAVYFHGIFVFKHDFIFIFLNLFSRMILYLWSHLSSGHSSKGVWGSISIPLLGF